MNILAIDTVFNKCGVAIMTDNEVIYHDQQVGKRQQTQQILPMIDNALQSTGLTLHDFSALAFNRGPGAFSGIRINTAVIQALSVATDIPCVAVSSLQILAQAGWQASNENADFSHMYAVLDARMKQVYLGEFQLDNGLMQAVHTNDNETEGNETLLDYHALTAKNLPIINWIDDNEGLSHFHDEQLLVTVDVNADILATLAYHQFGQQGGVPAEQALPVYLRNNAWKTLKEQGK